MSWLVGAALGAAAFLVLTAVSLFMMWWPIPTGLVLLVALGAVIRGQGARDSS